MSGFIPGLSQSFDHGPYTNGVSPTQNLDFPKLYDCTTAWSAIVQAKPSAPVYGINGEMAPCTIDLDSESPHILVSACTGGGKSATLRSIAAQILRNGGVATILDYKQHSHMWAKGLPNVGYAENVSQIGNALCELGREVHRRNAIVNEWLSTREPGRTIDNAPVGPRIVVLFEELNSVMSQLKAMTRRIPAGTYTAMDALNDLVFMGRAAKVHVLANLQFPDYRVISQALVENFGLRIMIDYTKNAWVKIAWDAGLPVAAPQEVGRGMAVHGSKCRETQFLYLTEGEARAMALEPFDRSRGVQMATRGH